MKNFKIIVLAFFICGVATAGYGQTTGDTLNSGNNSTVPTYNIQPESVQFADTTANIPSSSVYQSSETETIRIYSGSHTGNNIVRTMEVPLPAANSRNGYYSPR
jgi:hypothetical protein